MPRVTIANLQDRIQELVKERDSVEEGRAIAIQNEIDVREEFTKVIGNMEVNVNSRELSGRNFDTLMAYHPPERTRETMSWSEIFFAIGELNADANIQCMKDTICRLHTEAEDLKCQLEMKKVPGQC